MQTIPNKSSGDTLTGSEFSDLKNESQNVITDTGIILSGGDVNQLGKSIANYVGAGDFYDETGIADAYVATVIGSRKGPTAYFDGLRVRLRPGNTNTGSSTLNVNGLGVKNIDGTTVAGTIQAGADYTFLFDSGADAFTIAESSLLANPAQSKTTDGFVTLPGGIILQWGAAPVSPSDIVGGITSIPVTFPIAYPNAIFNIEVSIRTNGATTMFADLGFHTPTVTGFTISIEETTGTVQNFNSINWFAIGH